MKKFFAFIAGFLFLPTLLTVFWAAVTYKEFELILLGALLLGLCTAIGYFATILVDLDKGPYDHY